MLTYGPNGRSRGIATIVFSNPGSASKAAQELNGVKVDNRAMKIEVIVDAKSVPAPPAPKTLGDRISKPRNAARETTKAKPAAATGAAPAANGTAKTGKKKSGRGGKPKAKSADELDAEMKDYFGGNEANSAVANGEVQAVAAAVTNGGDTGMDEIS
ncbi:RNA-binding RNA annealing protein [Oleoguttula sp. CCFEE 5521]